jgi:hypothetical protein
VSSLHISGFWHETIRDTKHLIRSRTPISQSKGSQTLRPHGPNPAFRQRHPARSKQFGYHWRQIVTFSGKPLRLGLTGLSRAKRHSASISGHRKLWWHETRIPTDMWLSRRSVCAPLVLEVGVRLRVDGMRPCYVRAKYLKCVTTTLRYSRFKTRFFASFLFAFEKK